MHKAHSKTSSGAIENRVTFESMKSSQPLGPFDRALVRKHKDRAAKRFEQARFLKDRTIEDICDRLEFINRHFATVLDVGSQDGYFKREVRKRPQLIDKISYIAQSDFSTRQLGQATNSAFVCDEELLPISPDSLNLIVSALTLHWVNDLPGFLVQARMALKPDGLLLVSFLGGRTLQELRATIASVETQQGLQPSARVSPFADAQDGAQLLQRAGFALPVADSDVVTVRYDSVFGLFRDLKAMGETAAFLDRPAKPLNRTQIAAIADQYSQDFADPDGRIRATFEIITLTGWAPHTSQQKPLRRGSAKMRLADALGVVEFPIDDKQ
jgi:SAM-dependent methyltransferase